MGYRYDEDINYEYTETQRRLKDTVRRGSLDEFVTPSDERARVNISLDDDGNVHQDEMDCFSGFGIAVRPDLDVSNEVIVANVGASDDGAVIIASQDSAKLNVLTQEPLEGISSLFYASDLAAENTKRILITLEEIRLGNLNGDEKELAYTESLQDVYEVLLSLQTSHNALLNHYKPHTHLAPSGATGGPLPIPNLSDNTGTATITGTTITKAE